MDIVKTFLNLALVGGEWVLYLLIFSSVLSIAVMIQKTIYFYRNRIHWEEFSEMLTGFLNRDDPEAALDYVRQHTAPAARVVESGLLNIDKGPEAVEEIMIAKRLAEKFKMENKLVILGSLGNNAPFIGLFGTVLGIIKAFHDLATAENANPSVVMAGVSEALVATAVGLIVAIPAVMAYNYFQRKVKEAVTQMEAASKMLLVYVKTEAKPGVDQRARI
ncbi:MAG TPA: MotA/TolQ/ExbB proton channel family protein [Acidobacteriota bacterium]|jgi:biopolymer transport protein ExbB|nr:MotA/TolQ/ExbB proton channel family protein [Acidobacteriota bacterium]